MRSYWSCVWYSVFVMSKIKESFTLHIETLWDFISKCASNMPVFSHNTGRAYAGRILCRIKLQIYFFANECVSLCPLFWLILIR